jgi:hypothetical protein
MVYSKLLREGTQVIMGLALVGASIYLAIIGELPMEFFCTLVGVALGFFMAERKNGQEIAHVERMVEGRAKWRKDTL